MTSTSYPVLLILILMLIFFIFLKKLSFFEFSIIIEKYEPFFDAPYKFKRWTRA